MTQAEKIISWAKKQIGTNKYNGYCQKFVRLAYEAGGIYGSAATATEAYKKWCVSSDRNNIPAGAAVYFNGTDPSVGHVALSIGGGRCINPAAVVYVCSISSIPNFRGWGWQGGCRPDGAAKAAVFAVSSANKTKTAAVKTQKQEITKTVIKSVSGAAGVYRFDKLYNSSYDANTFCELLIENNVIYAPVIKGEITLEINKSGSPSKLKFTVIKDEIIDFREGSPVRLKVKGKIIFFGYVFTKTRRDEKFINVTAYDQLRYLKNKDSYIYENKKYSELLTMIANDYNLRLGNIADTGYVIERRVEEGTLFDILANAAELTFKATGKRFVLFDDEGKITLRAAEDMKTDICIDETQMQGYEYSTSIDKNVYDRIKLSRDNDETGEREFYVFNGAENMENWGLLQYYERLGNKDEDINLKGKTLLEKYNLLYRSLWLKNVFGDISVRGGSVVYVKMNPGDIVLSAEMTVESVIHRFKDNYHFMDMQLSGRGGEFR